MGMHKGFFAINLTATLIGICLLSGNASAQQVVNQCIETVKNIRGDDCGSRDSHLVEIRNRCQREVDLVVCVEDSSGRAQCGSATNAAPGEKALQYVCHGTGRSWLKACIHDSRGTCAIAPGTRFSELRYQ